MTSTQTTLDRLSARAGTLYSLPAVAMEVLELTRAAQVDSHALKECIEKDPALTGRLLRVVNSSLFGLGSKVSDLGQALALFGIKPLKLLVLGFSLPNRLFDGVAADHLGRYWRHTLTKAVASRQISEAIGHQPADEVFLAGLLQDVGLLMLIQELNEPYMNLLEKVRSQDTDLLDTEIESMGFDHTQLSARLLASWGLPDLMVDAVESERHDPASRPSRMKRILYLAELFARLLADGRKEALAELVAIGQRDHGLSRTQLVEMATQLNEKVHQLADVLSLQLPEGMDSRDLLVEAHRQLSEVAGDTAIELVRTRPVSETPKSQAENLLADFEDLSDELANVLKEATEAASSTPPGKSMALEVVEPKPADVAPASSKSGPSDLLFDSGVGSESLIPGSLTAAVSACHDARCPLSLLLVEWDDVDDMVRRHGVESFNQLRRALEGACENLDHPNLICTAFGEVGFAVILPDGDRQPAVQFGHRLIEWVRRAATSRVQQGHPSVRIAVGIATVSVPTRGFQPEDLWAAAERCLYGSHASGGSVVKSIEIY